MLELLKHYTSTQIIIFTVLLALAAKSCISFFQWLFPRMKQLVYKTDAPVKMQKNIKRQADEIIGIKDDIQVLTKKVDTLIKSDRDDIKAFITREHHYFCYQKGWIDDYSLDCIEKRFEHYIQEGGNSFIQGLMKEIRRLPKQAPGETR